MKGICRIQGKEKMSDQSETFSFTKYKITWNYSKGTISLENIPDHLIDEIRELLADHDESKEIIFNNKVGVCCFCEGECNPMSQSCGGCTRNRHMG